MKNLKFLIIVLAIVVYSCERDDICASGTPTTPQLLLEFFDVTDVETLKSVTRLSVYGEAFFLDENGILEPPITADNRTIIFNTNENKIALPLLIGIEGAETITKFALEKETNLRVDDENATTISNIDIIEIKYTSQFIYVSRACGFKSIFTNLSVTIIDDGDTWIQSFSFPSTTDNILTVENENETHVQLFH